MAFQAIRKIGPRTFLSQNTLDFGLGKGYGEVLGFEIQNEDGGDAAIRLKLVDADSKVIYLDAADKDYEAAQVNTRIIVDDTTTGLSWVPRDATGAAAASGQTAGIGALARSPVTASIVNGTSGDEITLSLWVRV